MPQLFVQRLTLTDFRNYARLRLDVGPGAVVLTGANGAGKTNLLEAVSFLAPGRGLRGAKLPQVGRQGQTGSWGVNAVLSGPDGLTEIGTGLTASAPERRAVQINGHPAKGGAAIARQIGVVWLTPAMDRLFLDGPASRRKFLDRLVTAFDADQAGRIAAYDHAHRQRSRLLREEAGDAAWFAALEDTMARHGVALAAARADLVARLSRALAASAGPFPAASLKLVGAVDSWLAEMPAVDAEDKMRASLWDERRGILGAGAGPHRSDLGVAMIAPPLAGERHPSHGQPAALCSTGEQKALLISIVLAHARLQREKRGSAPVLLLDEIAAHLDAGRRAALFGELRALGAQAWMTGTDAGLFEDVGESARFFNVDQGAVMPPELRQ
ncbi:MAG: DNA replication/repair protein RecF [Rhodospirillaceae bacterium]|nr:DNA replication/repair protein RecF [Rhodospirillaceae bacterium]